MPVLVKVKQNKIPKSKANGKWYGHVVTTKTMTYQELCKHMSEHNSIYGEDVCLGIANKLQNCILEQLLEGKKVQFGELGTFYLSVKSAGAEKEKDFNLGTSIHGLYLCFSPSRTDVNNLSSKMLKKNQKFRLNRPVRTTIHRGIVHVLVSVDVNKGTDLQKVIGEIQEEVNNTLLYTAETVPFDVQVKVESIL